MTASAPAPASPRPHRAFAGLSLAAALLALAAASVALTGSGCSKPPTAPSDPGSTGPKGDPWKVAGVRLKKDTDLGATKSALLALTADVSGQEGQKLPALTDEAFAALAAVVPLSPADREEIRAGAFSAHDAVYLADCFYLRDAARSLGVAGLPPEKQAEVAFAWVCRQVYLQPWPRPIAGGFEPTVLPPTAVLRRGFGSGLERMYVFLALLQQLELDGCLIGAPDAGRQESRTGPALSYPFVTQVRVPRGPFWAVGVRAGADVRLFDPWRGRPFPVTLAQLKANPDAAKAWFEDAANLSGATLTDARTATVFLAIPVNALSPRMGAFEAQLKGELGVEVATDAAALAAKRAAFPDPKPAFWNPPDDLFAYGRAARSYLPLDMGGSDPTPTASGRLYESALREQIPATAFVMPAELRSLPAQQRLGLIAATMLAVAFIEPPNPRERIQRGQYQDAARDIVSKQEQFAAGLERLRSKDMAEKQIADWVTTADELYDAVGAARLGGNKGAEAAAAAQAEGVWKMPGAQLLIDRASAEVGRAEALFLLGLCKHEQAERLQVRLDRAAPADAVRLKADALDAWKTALAAWRTYEQHATAHVGFPGRAAHAGGLSARAAKFAEGDPKK